MPTTLRGFLRATLCALAAGILGAAAAMAQTDESGKNPNGRLLQANDGYLYGTTSDGGADGFGTVFRLDLAGNAVTVHSFGDIDGAHPAAGLIQATDGNFYGTTTAGGSTNLGVVFRMDPSFQVTVLHSFGGPDGANPYAPVMQSGDGNLYGTTPYGGAVDLGTIFRIDPSGNFTSLYSFKGEDSEDGAWPFGGLLGTDQLIGTTVAGGHDGNGIVFAYDTFLGSLETYHSFMGYYGDGALPYAGLTYGVDGMYGVTQWGGDYGCGTVFRLDYAPVITIHSFAEGVDGCEPAADLVDSNYGLYGTTLYGGPNDAPTMFRVDDSGAVTTVHIFDDSEGGTPSGPLILASDGNFYGTATGGGAYGYGAVYRTEPSGNTVALYSFGAGDGFPTITSFSPTAGPSNTKVTINGTGFTGASSVKFNGTAAPFTVLSSTQLTARVASGTAPGKGKITVTTPAGTATSAGDFIFAVRPTVTGFTPGSGVPGTTVVITGTNFETANAVVFDTASAIFTINSPTQITATVPSAAKTGLIKVTNLAGAGLSAANFLVPPTINSFSPTSGLAGTNVIITGKTFLNASSVTFNGIAATFTVNSAIKITATVPSDTSTGKIAVTTPGGTATSATNFMVLPTITSFTPTAGPVNTKVTINGTGFGGGVSSVKFNGKAAAAFTVLSLYQLTARVAPGTTSGKITVTTPAGTATSATNFIVAFPPTVIGFTPGSGVPGTTVIITGTNFETATAVVFDTASAIFTINSPTQITATVPSAAKTGKIKVTNLAGSASSVGTFLVPPTINSFSPISGHAGTTVIISGKTFLNASSVTFNGVAATFTVNSSIKITATVPSGASSGKIAVTTPGGTATSATNFTVLP